MGPKTDLLKASTCHPECRIEKRHFQGGKEEAMERSKRPCAIYKSPTKKKVKGSVDFGVVDRSIDVANVVLQG
jgi:hypothetical protein